jgi:hypothetical protein
VRSKALAAVLNNEQLNLPGRWIPDTSSFSESSAMLFGEFSSSALCTVTVSANKNATLEMYNKGKLKGKVVHVLN